MLNWKNVRLILHREIRDQLRDRRTLFMITLLPLFLYPALGMGMMEMMTLFTEQKRTVVLLGEGDLPDVPLVENHRFATLPPEDAHKLEVLTATNSADPALPVQVRQEQAERVAQATRIWEKIQQRERLQGGPPKESKIEPLQIVDPTSPAAVLQNEIAKEFAASKIEVLVVIPQDFSRHLRETALQLHGARPNATTAAAIRPRIVFSKADDKSKIAFFGVREAFDNWEREILEKQLEAAGLPVTTPAPVNVQVENVAQAEQEAANLWSRLLPALLVIMTLTGAFYPAIDLGAGEKERGTMETLLICPATRTEIVLGKFGTVLLFSLSTAVLNLISIGATGWHMTSVVQKSVGGGALPSLPTWEALGWVALLMLPLAVMFSALCLALATFARSSKEGQYYLTPLLMVTLGLTVFCMSPGIELTNDFYCVLPVIGVNLLLKGILLNPDNAQLYLYMLPVVACSIGYSVVALWWAIDQFQREDVLFREAERFDLRMWWRHLLRDKDPTPTFGEAAVCFFVIMMLQFGMMNAIQSASIGPGGQLDFWGAVRGSLITQIAIIGSPALFMAVLLTSRPGLTLRIAWPRWEWLALACVMPFAMHPVMAEFSAYARESFPEPPRGAEELGRLLGDSANPLWMTLIALALAPAVCEELAFRGFILSGFQQHGRTRLAIVLSSVMFGIMHMLPHQAFNAALLGLMLGLFAIRSGSLLPGVLFHFLYNALGITSPRLHASGSLPLDGWVFTQVEGQTHFAWPTLLVALAIVAVGVARLAQVREWWARRGREKSLELANAPSRFTASAI